MNRLSDTTNEETHKHFYLTAKVITSNTKISANKMSREPEDPQYCRILLVWRYKCFMMLSIQDTLFCVLSIQQMNSSQRASFELPHLLPWRLEDDSYLGPPIANDFHVLVASSRVVHSDISFTIRQPSSSSFKITPFIMTFERPQQHSTRTPRSQVSIYTMGWSHGEIHLPLFVL